MIKPPLKTVRPIGILLSFKLTLALASCSSGPTDNQGRKTLSDTVAQQSRGALAVTTFTKTNGVRREVAGQAIYTLEYSAVLRFSRNAWKGGNAFEGAFGNFGVADDRPGGFGAMGKEWKLYYTGDEVEIHGQITLERTDNGWRPTETSVKGYRVRSRPQVAGFLGTWHAASRNMFFRIEDDPSRGLRYSSVSVTDDGQINWTYSPSRLENGSLTIQYAEGSDRITIVSQQELTVMEEDAFNRTTSKALRFDHGPERIVAVSREAASKPSAPAESTASPPTVQETREAPTQAATGSAQSRIGRWSLPDDLAFLGQRPLNPGEIGGLSRIELRRLRNFIYARHGRAFTSPDLQEFFKQQPWYRVNTEFSESQLSSIERANVATIAKAENSGR